MKALSIWPALFFLFAFPATPGFPQDIGAGYGHRGLNVFGTFTAARSGQGVGYLWGGSAGSYLQGRFLGFGVRATDEPSNNAIHLFEAVTGPRVAVSFPFVRAYLEAGGGMGRSGYYDRNGNYGSSWAPAWQADAGVTHGILPRLSWRILEVGYGRIYAGPGVSPLFLSSGITLHIW